jgi:outer membrane protein assembly factor BamB
MQAYRETSPGAPLVSMLAKHIVVLDAETGALRWKQPVERRITRIVVAGALVFVAADEEHVSTILLFDLATGAPKGSVLLSFYCNGALVSGDRVYFSGAKGILAMRNDGRVMFHISPQIMKKSAWDGDTIDLVGHDATARETWRLPKVAIDTMMTYLSVGSDVAQIDID